MAPMKRAKAVPRTATATCSSPHHHTTQTSAPRSSPPHCPRLRTRRQPREPAQGAGEAGSSSPFQWRTTELTRRTPPPEEAMVHCKQARKRPREPAGVPGTGGRACAAAGAARPTSSSCAREMAPMKRAKAVRAKAMPRSSPHRHTTQTSAPRSSPPHRPRLRARRQPREPAQGAGEAGSLSLVGRRPSAHHLGSFGARQLFGGNAEKHCDKKGAIAGGEDRLSTLPEEVIQLVLSFLSSRQAVRTCVLATHWRTLWKSVPSLRFNAGDEPCECWHEPGKCIKDLKCFIDSFVRCRDPTPLRECEILIGHNMDTEEFRHDCDLWLRYAVSCKVRVLRFEILRGEFLQLSVGTLISQHLTRLILRGIECEDFCLDSCQSLEVLEMLECGINIRNAFPKSLQHLRIRHTRFSPDDTRSIISAPGLVTLELGGCLGWTPLLNRLPALVTAFINIGCMGLDSCAFDICARESCVNCSGLGDDDSVLLQGLSGAANLELRSHHSMIFNKDIRRCPVFSKLKTLMLGDWCIRANFSGLVYFLQHSPILERLTLDTSYEAFHVQASERYKPKERFLVSEHLKEVTVGYVKVDGRIRPILKLLAYHGVPSELIHTEEQSLSYSCRFEDELSDTAADEEEEEEVGTPSTSTGEDVASGVT